MRTIVFALLGSVGLTGVIATHSTTPIAAGSIQANDNRIAAGTLAKNVLTVSLEARVGTWQPDGPGGATITTAAFGEVGKSLQTPGPIIRVPAGTTVRASIHNALAKPMWVYGLGAKRGIADSTQVAAGATGNFQFVANDVGSYYYVARTDTFPVFARLTEDTQLGGVIVVDPPGAKPNDRVFAVTSWFTIDPTRPSFLGKNGTMAFNGRTFPNNEHFELTQGDSAHWRFVNLTFIDHPLHLHGYYFRVDSHGDGLRDTVYSASDRRMGNVEYMAPMQTMSLSWSPDRPGNWIFHCHFAGHMAPRDAWDADRTTLKPAAWTMPHTGAMAAAAMPHMANLVMGIRVKPKGAVIQAGDASRNMRMLIRSKTNVYGGKYVGYSFVLGGTPAERDAQAMPVPGPVLELTRGERVAFTIVNQSHEGAAIHWHGIELESYADGVPDVSGDPGHVLPIIKPGDSIMVHYTPPRSGTFLYHSHSNEFQQISSGLYGALLVRDPGPPRDTTVDKVLIISDNGPTINLLDPSQLAKPLLNGKLTPDPISLRGGVATRLRLINIRSDVGMLVMLMDGDKPAMWRNIAKDGFTRPASQAQPRPAVVALGAGETYDFEVTPSPGQSLSLAYELVAPFPPELKQRTVVPVRIR
jgi:FtsP/CotA-like multicopper oxidase with cupredoxin domain